MPMDPSYLLFFAVLAPVLAGLVTLLLPRTAMTARVMIALAGMAASFLSVLYHVTDLGAAPVDATGTATIRWVPILNLNIAFLADGLGTFFALLVSGIGVLIVLYARAYFGPNRDDLYRFFPTLGFFATAMMGIVLADYTLLTLLFWEMTSISSFLLIGWDRYDKKAVKLAMQAFFTTGFGGMMLFGGVLLLGEYSSVWRWSDLENVTFNTGTMWAFVLMFIGAASKSAQFPFHYWLPGAMAAPTPVSAYLHSATMVKAGVYLVARLFPVFAALELWPWLILPIGAVTMLLGALIAINQHDLKRIFAYTTVSQLGLLMAMYGLGAIPFTYHGETYPAIDLDIAQIANHAFYKAPLFIIAGALGHVASRNITRLNGAFYKHPMMAGTMILAGYALAGLPLSISFQAKELFLYAIYHASETIGVWWLLVMGMAIVTAMCNVAIFVRLTTTLLGLPGGMTEADGDGQEDHPHHDHEHGFWPAFLWLPALLLVSFQFIGGIFTPAWNAAFGPLENVTHENYIGHKFHGMPALWDIEFGTPLICSLIAIGGGFVLGFSRLFRGAIVDVCDHIYPLVYRLCVLGGGRAFRVIQTGHLRHYIMFVLATFLVGFFSSLYIDPSMIDPVVLSWNRVGRFWTGIFLGVVICVSAFSLVLTQDRPLRVLLLGAAGFAVVGMYLVYEAPDLALTQLLFEIISVILFVLVLRLLPANEGRAKRLSMTRITLSAASGIAFGWMTIIAATSNPSSRLGDFFLKNSYLIDGSEDYTYGGGGMNVVNVILVDFRGFDTIGEICVLAIAAFGVWSMLPPRSRRPS